MQVANIQRTPNLTIIHPKEHKHTLIWIHGLAIDPESDLSSLITSLGQKADKIKILMPKAPERYVTVKKGNASSWFDIKFRGQQSFIVPFDQAFSSSEVYHSYQTILLPLIEQQSKKVKAVGGKLIVAGFSQGCGMSIHCLYNKPELVDAAIGISGYFFPITNFKPAFKDSLTLIYGLADTLRPWEYVKVTYYGRLSETQMHFIPGMKHEINKDTVAALNSTFDKILS